MDCSRNCMSGLSVCPCFNYKNRLSEELSKDNSKIQCVVGSMAFFNPVEFPSEKEFDVNVNSINQKIKESILTSWEGRKREINVPDQILKDYFVIGQNFKGAPVITRIFNSLMEFDFELKWQSDSTDHLIKGTNSQEEFFFAGLEIKNQISSVNFNENTMIKLFEYFRKTVPHEFIKDGCNARCIWISFVLQEVFNLESYKIKVFSIDGVKKLSTVSPFPENAEWFMHTAPVVKMKGADYVFDISLDQPIPINDWKRSLCFSEDHVIISTESNWKDPCLRTPWIKGTPENFEEVIKQLRAYYLFEKIDGNDDQNSSPENWGLKEGLTPISSEIKQDDRKEVIVSVKTNLDGSVNYKTKSIELSGLSQFVLYEGRYYTNKALKELNKQ